jgi:CYTH domain-containing protein
MTARSPGNADGGAIVPGHRDKYAVVERERRFLLAAPPSGVRLTDERQITDRYLTGTRLRLRRVTRAGRADPELKLTQKVPASRGGPGPVSGLITNFYLSQAEYDLLATLPAAELAKTRRSFPPYVVDVFGAPHHGLVLAEVELASDAELAACPAPAGSVAEVTADARFTGGRLAVTPRPELLRWLAEYGLTVQDDQEASDPARATPPRSPRTH